ncbi:MAG: serine/threonine-protein kinase [Candidatus Melainabacteria bacterium]|nr:serine/threonine-protein kinase [Candidatus Melainabacteria bacterium]
MASVDKLVGAVIEKRFKLESVIGQGGLSTVYKGHHETAGFPVAVKVLHSDYSDTDESRERFKREAAIINHLNHPNIVHMYSFGFLSNETEGLSPQFRPGSDPLPYLVLEHLSGYGLDDILDQRYKLSENLAYRLVAGVIEGLQFAHERGIVHRDIKPSNVMVIDELSDVDKSYPGPYSQHVKLLDFGIAKCNAHHDKKPADLTQPGFVFGSPLYMSPEQCKGQEVDQRSDIYSLGCMYYEMLKGEPPFKGESAVHTFAMHLYEKPVTLPIGKGDGLVSQELNDIIMKCLEKEREARWLSVSQLRQALKDLYKF